MPSNAEIAKDTIEQFKKIQRYMRIAKKENATQLPPAESRWVLSG